MLGIRFMKAPPTAHVIHYRNGRICRQGAGLSFFYHAPTSTVVTVPMESADLPYAFQELTSDFQTVTVQGQLAYRVTDPATLAALLDFSLDTAGRYQGDGPEILRQRLVQAVQVLVRAVLQRMTLREALVSLDLAVEEVRRGLLESTVLGMLGVEVVGVSISSVRPTPEMARALEADAREALQRQADLAVYERRNSAIDQERRIRENEMATELSMEEKKRQIRESQMAADIAVEEQRTLLLEQRLANDREEADARAHALEAILKPVRDMDWRTLMAVAPATDPRLMIAVAFRELAENAAKIGELNISPDLLKSLLSPK